MQVLIEKELTPEKSETYRRYQQLMDWAENAARWGCGPTPTCRTRRREAIAFGAEGIGLCRTEHMFFDHIVEFREMILAENEAGREKALDKLLPFQRGDFAGLFRAMAGRPVTIRRSIRRCTSSCRRTRPARPRWPASSAYERRGGRPARGRTARVEPDARPPRLPSGHRLPGDHGDAGAGDLRGGLEVHKAGMTSHPEVMIPLAGFSKELRTRRRSCATRPRRCSRGGRDAAVSGRHDDRGAPGRVTAGEIAKSAEFFSFGTNDLTQTTLGMSRDDYGGLSATCRDTTSARRPVRDDRPGRRRGADEDRRSSRAGRRGRS